MGATILGPVWEQCISILSELETVLHVLTSHKSHPGTHLGTYGEIWEQILEQYMDVRGSTIIIL